MRDAGITERNVSDWNSSTWPENQGLGQIEAILNPDHIFAK